MNLHERPQRPIPDEYATCAKKLNTAMFTEKNTIRGFVDLARSEPKYDFHRWVVRTTQRYARNEYLEKKVSYHNAYRSIIKGVGSGAVLGYFIAQAAYKPTTIAPSDVLQNIDVSATLPYSESEKVYDSDIVRGINTFGEIGCQLAGQETTQYLESWAPYVVPEIRYQSTVATTAGIVFHALDRAFFERDIERLDNTQLVDWDALDWTS